MILELTAQAPPLVRALAAAILYLHIGLGFLGMAAGAVALAAPKGRPVHRVAGTVFFVAMLVVAAIGAGISPFLPRWISVLAGLLTFYLVATSWATVKRRPGTAGRFETLALAFALLLAAFGLWLGWLAGRQPDGALHGEPGVAAFVFAGIAALAAAGDLHMILRRGVSGPPRLARHLWRMCLALLIALLSFIAQPRAVPEVLRGSPLVYAPLLLVLAVTLFWLVRVRIPPRRKAARPAV